MRNRQQAVTSGLEREESLSKIFLRWGFEIMIIIWWWHNNHDDLALSLHSFKCLFDACSKDVQIERNTKTIQAIPKMAQICRSRVDRLLLVYELRMCLQGRYSPEATWSTFSPYVATITVTQIRSLFFSSLFRWKQKDFRLGDERIEQEVRDKEIDDLLDFWPYYQVIGVNISWSSALAWRNNENYFELFFEVWNQVQIQVALFSNDLNETAIGNLDDRSIWRRKWKRCIGNTTWTKWNDSKEIIEKEIGDRFGEVLLETKVENKTKCEVRAAHLIFGPCYKIDGLGMAKSICEFGTLNW